MIIATKKQLKFLNVHTYWNGTIGNNAFVVKTYIQFAILICNFHSLYFAVKYLETV